MADKTKIEWADATWNVITGCSVTSPACTNCYAMRLAGTRLREHPSRKGLTKFVNGKPVWTGEVRFNEQWLTQPLRWKRPRKIFVCAHGDLFHESVPDEWIDKVFAVMALAPRHTFQVLTKRSNRMREYLTGAPWGAIEDAADEILTDGSPFHVPDTLDRAQAATAINRRPLPNVWLGVSVEDQARADERIPDLLATPAAKRFVSIEPMLGPIDLTSLRNHAGLGEGQRWLNALGARGYGYVYEGVDSCPVPRLDLVICGGESGPNARPMHPDWPRSLRDQCATAGVPFNFKQWGEWVGGGPFYFKVSGVSDIRKWSDGLFSARVGKRRAGCLLDGVEHDGVLP